MREQREPWLKVPEKHPGSPEDKRPDPRFRTHIVGVRGGGAAAPSRAPAEPPAAAPSPPAPVSPPTRTVLPFSPAGATRPKPVPVERTEPALSTPVAAPRPASAPRPPAPPAPRNAAPPVSAPTPRPAPKRTGVRAPGAPPLGINDLPAVSSADWVAKVGEATKMVDVVVVFYTAAYLGSEMFDFAFQTVVNEVLPQLSRPYSVYRFSLDAEPRFVSEMAESLGLVGDNPVTAAGFAWSGPGRPLLIIGDRALQSRSAFSRFLRQSLESRQAPLADKSGARRSDFAELERPRERASGSRARLLGGRTLAVLAWCLFGTAALGAAVVGVKPQWARSLLHSTVAPGAAVVPKASPEGGDMQINAAPPAASLDTPTGGTPGLQAQAPVNSSRSAPVHTPARKKRAPRPPTYLGFPEDLGR
jgi:hypothetical protein